MSASHPSHPLHLTHPSHPSIPDAATELSDDEAQEVHERVPPRVGVVHETIRLEGEHELHRPLSALAWSGLAAGMSMGFSLLGTGVIHAALPDRPWRPLVAALGYTTGFLVVIVGRQQLFTENSITPVIPLLHNRDVRTLLRLLRLWAVVLVTNLVGAAAFAWTLAKTDVLEPEVRAACGEIGLAALDGSFATLLVRAVFAGWLIALMVWLLANAGPSRVAIVIIVTYLIGAAKLSHVIAGSVDVLYVVARGTVRLADYLRFLVPTLLGNMLGGAALVAAIGHAQTIADAD